MRSTRLAIPAAFALSMFAACGDPTSSDSSLFDDTAVTQDVAASAGDAIGLMLSTMVDNEVSAGGEPPATTPPTEIGVNVTRTRACYDSSGAPVTNCLPFSSVRMIVAAVSLHGNRSSTRTNAAGQTVTWTGSLHRTSNDTARRVFVNTTETSRVHTDVAVGHDTTTFIDGLFMRKIAELVQDSAKNVTFNLPRSSNPYPVSGSIVRRSTATVSISKEDKHFSRDVSHRVEVVFPADAQANVTLKVDARTCQLNLVTHAVTNCQ
jgi:hypothetical protein